MLSCGGGISQHVLLTTRKYNIIPHTLLTFQYKICLWGGVKVIYHWNVNGIHDFHSTLHQQMGWSQNVEAVEWVWGLSTRIAHFLKNKYFHIKFCVHWMVVVYVWFKTSRHCLSRCLKSQRPLTLFFRAGNSLKTNEWPWANRSGRSEEMSDRERIAQVAQDKWAKWANERFAQKHFG